ncbi:hypothetical protein CEXT_355821, partial [Caerostris extrusa]
MQNGGIFNEKRALRPCRDFASCYLLPKQCFLLSNHDIFGSMSCVK